MTDRTVTWTSGNPAVATVDATGAVKGIAAGSTTITAASKAAPDVKGAASVTVGAVQNASVTISSINSNATGLPVNIANVVGQVDVVLNVDPGQQALAGVDLVVNNNAPTFPASSDTIVATQNLSAGVAPSADAASAPVVLSFNTASFNATSGKASFKNGATQVKAKARVVGGTQVASNTTTITLNNTDGVVVTTKTSKTPSGADANGLPWWAGDVTVSTLPVIYSGRTIATVTMTIPGATAQPGAVTAAASGATTATWSSTATTTGARVTQQTLTGGNVNGLPIGVHPTVLLIDSNGNSLLMDSDIAQLNATSQSDLRIDNQSPAAPTTSNLSAAAVANNNWITAAYTFTGTGKYVSGGDNGGVNNSTLTVFYAPNDANVPAALGNVGGILTDIGSKCVTTGYTQVSTGNDIPNSTIAAYNTAYVVRVLETDKLGNVRCSDLSTGGVRTVFGVDKSPPVASLSAQPANQTSATTAGGLGGGGNLTVTFSDSLSGFSGTPFQVITTRLDATGTTCIVGTGANCTANPVAGGPVSVVGGSATDGYFTTSIKVVDQAGNVTDLGSRTYLVDATAPAAVAGVAIPANITANSAQAFSSAFTDNLDLISGDGSVVYPLVTSGNMALFYAGSMSPAGVTFDNVLNRSGTSAINIPAFIIDLEEVTANAPPGATGAGVKPNTVNVRAIDGVGNFTANAAPLPQANIAGAVATEFTTANFATFQVSNAVGNVKNGTSNSTTPTSVTLTATVTGAVSTANNPFTQVCFYYQNTAAGQSSTNEWVQINCQTAAAVTDVGAVRTWTYTAPAAFDPPASLGTAGNLQIRAIGMNAVGNAITTNTNANLTLIP